jgi:hypothetical protein
MTNMKHWDKLSKSDPKFLKKVSFGSRSFTAIDPQYQVRMMTEEFGPIGEGWGWDSTLEHVPLANGDMMVLAHVHVWHTDRANKFGAFVGCRKFFDNAKGRAAEDAPKMAVTDGLTKALSHIGCNADVFLGEMDGNKYAADSGKPSGSGW